MKNNILKVPIVKPYEVRIILSPLIWRVVIDVGCSIFFISLFFMHMHFDNIILLACSLPFMLFCYLCIRLMIEEGIIYVQSIVYFKSNFIIDYYNKNKKETVLVNVKNIKTEINAVSRGITHSHHLDIYDNSNLVLRQYAVHYWNIERMKGVAQKIENAKKEYIEEQNRLSK